MFLGLRKKKKPALTETELKWNLLWDKYADGSLEHNYDVLCDYYAGVNNGGHHCFLDNNTQRLPEYADSLKSLLPKDFFAEFYNAFTAYIQNNNVEKYCDSADDYFYKNENVIIDILQTYANGFDV